MASEEARRSGTPLDIYQLTPDHSVSDARGDIGPQIAPPSYFGTASQSIAPPSYFGTASQSQQVDVSASVTSATEPAPVMPVSMEPGPCSLDMEPPGLQSQPLLSLESEDEIERLQLLQITQTNGTSDSDHPVTDGELSDEESNRLVTEQQPPITDGEVMVCDDNLRVPSPNRNDEAYSSYILDPQRRTKRFNTYKSRMIRTLNHLGSRTGCYGILYLRR
jgi:hypothetical protein